VGHSFCTSAPHASLKLPTGAAAAGDADAVFGEGGSAYAPAANVSVASIAIVKAFTVDILPGRGGASIAEPEPRRDHIPARSVNLPIFSVRAKYSCRERETPVSTPAKKRPVPTLVTYRAKPGKEESVQALVKSHWPTLHKLGLATSTPATIWRAQEKRSGKIAFIEFFEWKDEASSDVAHQTPEVMAIWEPMGAVLDGLEIAFVEPVQ
jgi:hypothetical protein